jgi:hypothetical protein
MYKRVLLSVVGAIAALSIGTAGAYFTAQVQVADSIIKAGAVATRRCQPQRRSRRCACAWRDRRSADGCRQRRLAPADIVVSAQKKAGVTDFYEQLTARVSCNGTELYNGPLSALKTAPLRLASGACGDLRFEIGLPAEASNTLAEDYAKVSLHRRRAGALMRKAPDRRHARRATAILGIVLALLWASQTVLLPVRVAAGRWGRPCRWAMWYWCARARSRSRATSCRCARRGHEPVLHRAIGAARRRSGAHEGRRERRCRHSAGDARRWSDAVWESSRRRVGRPVERALALRYHGLSTEQH